MLFTFRKELEVKKREFIIASRFVYQEVNTIYERYAVLPGVTSRYSGKYSLRYYLQRDITRAEGKLKELDGKLARLYDCVEEVSKASWFNKIGVVLFGYTLFIKQNENIITDFLDALYYMQNPQD